MQRKPSSLRQQIESFGLNPPSWNDHELGCPDQWPASLKTLAYTMLSSSLPSYFCWGEDRFLIFNRAYQPLLADRGKTAFGKKFIDVWPELWREFVPFFERVAQGETVVFRDHYLRLERKGFEEDTYFDFSLSPACDSEGNTMGLRCICSETTERIASEKRAALALEERTLESDRLQLHQEWLTATLRGIGDAVIATDASLVPKVA
ncbi:MAG: hypothetical protein EOP04_02720 [Proteobacteria bacterium]|nr:MAG: hypothetical protein EOP04_02720 [Pseudomonadota bacterium]